MGEWMGELVGALVCAWDVGWIGVGLNNWD